jgi:hypothetical protein
MAAGDARGPRRRRLAPAREGDGAVQPVARVGVPFHSEFRYVGRPLAALQGLDQDGRVIYLGTFSKVLFPALRLGYLVVPPNLIDAFTVARSLAGRCAVRDAASHPALMPGQALWSAFAPSEHPAPWCRCRLAG